MNEEGNFRGPTNQEVNHRSGIVNSREQIPIRGNIRGRRGRILRGGQRVRYSDQEGNDDRSDRSQSPDERSSRMDSVIDERESDIHDMERENGRRRMRESPQPLN